VRIIKVSLSYFVHLESGAGKTPFLCTAHVFTIVIVGGVPLLPNAGKTKASLASCDKCVPKVKKQAPKVFLKKSALF